MMMPAVDAAERKNERESALLGWKASIRQTHTPKAASEDDRRELHIDPIAIDAISPARNTGAAKPVNAAYAR